MRDLPEAYTKKIAFGLSDDVDLRKVFVLSALRFEKWKNKHKLQETYR